jgi:type VI secretion system Hcp family effector
MFYVTIVASKQGKIQGDVTEKGREGKIRGLDFSYEAEVLAAGGQLHRGPVVLTKAWDSTTPKLLQAFTENETLTSVLFEFWKQTATGLETVYQTVELDDAVVASLHWRLAEGVAHSAGAVPGARVAASEEHRANEIEDVAFFFKTMHVQNVTAKTAASDSWALSQA